MSYFWPKIAWLQMELEDLLVGGLMSQHDIERIYNVDAFRTHIAEIGAFFLQKSLQNFCVSLCYLLDADFHFVAFPVALRRMFKNLEVLIKLILNFKLVYLQILSSVWTQLQFSPWCRHFSRHRRQTRIARCP